MPQRLHLEGDDLAALLRQARREHGDDMEVLRTDRVRTGGVGGFFARQHYEVAVAVPDLFTPTRSSAAGSGATALDRLLAAADDGDGVSTAAPVPPPEPVAPAEPAPHAAPAEQIAPTRRPGRLLSTESEDFGAVLSSLRAQLLAPHNDPTIADAVVVPRPASGAVSRSATTPWVPRPTEPGPPPVTTDAAELRRRATDAAELRRRATAVGADPAVASAAAEEVGALLAQLPRGTEDTVADILLAGALARRTVVTETTAAVAAGQVVVALAPAAELATLAASLRPRLGAVHLARLVSGDQAAPGGLVGQDPRPGLDAHQVVAAAARAGEAGAVLVVLHAVEATEALDPLARVLRRLDPEVVLLGLDADASGRRVRAWLDMVGSGPEGVGPAVQVSLTACDRAEAPLTAAALAGPASVVLVDGRVPSVGTWTGILLDALSARPRP